MTPDNLREHLQRSLGAAYSIERELGGGGMSRVFLATEVKLGRQVVVKVLKSETGAGVSVERFKREIHLAAQIQNPHIVPLLTAGETEGLPYFTMPFVDGESLRARLLREKAMPLPDALRVLREIAIALAYAHDRGIVHRDIKPENVLLSSGTAMVTDFGIAKAVSEARTKPTDGTLTMAGTSLGTPAYMAPEQATGDRVDNRSDIYSWGIVAYELLAGRHPFADKATSQKLIAAHIAETPAPLLPVMIQRGLPSDDAAQSLSRLVMRTLEKDPSQRPQHATELVTELSAIGTPGIKRYSVSPTGFFRGPKGIGATAAAVAGLLVLAGIVSRQRASASTLDSKRVVVATFENRTGEPSLDSYGAMAADWIARGLTGSGMVDVAGTAAELAARGTTSSAAVGPAALEKLATDAGAGLIISGAYYKQGDSVLFQADFTDANASKLLQSVGPIGASVARPLDAVGPLRQRVMASLSTLLDPGLAGLAGQLHLPPSPEAYQEYLAGEDVFYKDNDAALAHFTRAAALDSSFVYPLLRSMSILTNQAKMEEADSVATLISRHESSLTDYERGYFNLSRAIAHGDQETVYLTARSMNRIAPKSAFASYGRAIGAAGSGRPREADSVFAALDPASGVMRGRIYYFTNYSVALHDIGDYTRQLDLVLRGEKQYPGRLYLLVDEVMALSALGRVDDANARIKDATTMPEDLTRSAATAIRVAIHELRYHGHTTEAKAVAARWTPWLTTRMRDSTSFDERTQIALALQAAEQWTTLKPLADSLAGVSPKDPYILALVGDSHAMLGDRAAAERAATRIGAMSGVAGRSQRFEARSWIAIALGDSAEALKLFKQSSPRGALDGEAGHGSWIFDRLRDYAPLKAYIVPRG